MFFVSNFPHNLWLILAIINFSGQLLYFRHDRSNSFFLAKKITTPLLLFGALSLVLTGEHGASPLIIVVLAAMGIGELGIEGSYVVEKTGRTRNTGSREEMITSAAGALFLIVNLLLGTALLFRSDHHFLLISICAGILLYTLLAAFFMIVIKPGRNDKFTIIIYSISLAVLFSGSISGIFTGISHLSLAGLLLTISDTLVLIRMGLNFEKKNRKEKQILGLLLISICLLYYSFIAVLINSSNPF